jgi:phosphoserine phosphatase RsbU/P
MQTRRRSSKEAWPGNLSTINTCAQHPGHWLDAVDVGDAAPQDPPAASISRDFKPCLTLALQEPGSRLDSWKQIASHFGREIRTVQRWEKSEGLPVHRHFHDKAGSVYAFPYEVDAWWKNRSVRKPGMPTTRIRETANQSALEEDFIRAIEVQSTLLPKRGLRQIPWETYYDYSPARGVGGDYCDLVTTGGGDLFFFFGDAVGKGLTGSMIASQLYSLFRALLSVGLPLHQMLERGNRLFCESMATDYYATVVCGRASSNGTVELVNAGHLPPLILRSGTAIPLAATGVPLGLFHSSTYELTTIQLAQGETLLFYTDGITEARNHSGVEYGPERLTCFLTKRSHLSPEELVRACVDDVTAFIGNTEPWDDRTLMALRRA